MKNEERLSVVVADDEPELLNAVCQLIDWEALGFHLVGRAGNGLDALQLVEQLQPDFLLTDIRMPFITGTALARQAKEAQPLIQIAFLSGYDDFEYAKQGIESEIVAYLLKPISMAELSRELSVIREKILRRLRNLTHRAEGGEGRQLLAATMMMDPYLARDNALNCAKLRTLGMELSPTDPIRVAAIQADSGESFLDDLVSTSETVLSQACPCSAFGSGNRVLALLGAAGGFRSLYAALDTLRQIVRRTWRRELTIGISKEFPGAANCREAFLDAMQALQLAASEGGIYAADGWDSMDRLCHHVTQIIEKEYMDETLSLQTVSDRLHVSANYLGTNLKRNAGDSFTNLLMKKRMTAAKSLLQNEGIRIAEVARSCGYSDQSYFGYCFKKFYGVSPARMRQGENREGGRL